MFTSEQRRVLLSLAREAITLSVRDGRVLAPLVDDAQLQTPLGAFVTLTASGELRGCIGFVEPLYPLYETIIHCGISAALRDPRFPPVTNDELAALQIEISVLSPLAPANPDEVVVGTHGLVVEKGHARGLLLPQVPVEWGWNHDEFLAHTCRKAGLPADAWQKGAKLFTFTADVFSEKEILSVEVSTESMREPAGTE